ncbi:8062_t:CDS:2 [Ambispora gerdemannii]|uniref:8062_t:CDS:1 n=1 Tax=Ambispora gerdemannii TaxID=144530 RepID=A0A9N9G1A4_9GLOM|nr:8062_t:CDS:2 [Ambispora gerdemannii]
MNNKAVNIIPTDIWTEIFKYVIDEPRKLPKYWCNRGLSRSIKEGVENAAADILRENVIFSLDVSVTRKGVWPYDAHQYLLSSTTLPFPIPCNVPYAAFSFPLVVENLEINALGLATIHFDLKYKLRPPQLENPDDQEYSDLFVFPGLRTTTMATNNLLLLNNNRQRGHQDDDENNESNWKNLCANFEFWKMSADRGVWWSGAIGVKYQFDLSGSFKLKVDEVLVRPIHGWI